MSEAKKYRLGNQPEEYELSEKYLGWIPEGFAGWQEYADKHLLLPHSEWPKELTLVSPTGQEKVAMIAHQTLIKDAFPLSFFGEERAENWHRFYKVSLHEKPEEKFVIPMH